MFLLETCRKAKVAEFHMAIFITVTQKGVLVSMIGDMFKMSPCIRMLSGLMSLGEEDQKIFQRNISVPTDV